MHVHKLACPSSSQLGAQELGGRVGDPVKPSVAQVGGNEARDTGGVRLDTVTRRKRVVRVVSQRAGLR